MKKRKIKKLLLLDWRRFWLLIGIGFVSIILHNLFYAFFGKEEPVFFIIAVILVPLYFLISLLYTIMKVAEHKRKKRNRKNKNKKKNKKKK